jgi:CheY-like chemotaxis protein
VLRADSGDQASETFRTNEVDLVLASADGEGKGFDLCRAFRKRKKAEQLPIVLMSAAANAEEQFAQHKKQGLDASGWIQLPVPPEDIVDWVERLIGLPPLPEGAEGSDLSFPGRDGPVGEATDARVVELKREMDALREQIHFYEQQLDQVSVTGEKESREMDQVLHDLQEDLEKERKTTTALQDELTLLKSGLGQKDKQAQEQEKRVGDLQEELRKETSRLKQELDSLRATFHDAQEKHKRAQNALREYYKPKILKVKKLEKTASGLEARVAESSEEIKALTSKVLEAEQENAKLKQELVTEREKGKKARDALKQLTQAFE